MIEYITFLDKPSRKHLKGYGEMDNLLKKKIEQLLEMVTIVSHTPLAFLGILDEKGIWHAFSHGFIPENLPKISSFYIDKLIEGKSLEKGGADESKIGSFNFKTILSFSIASPAGNIFGLLSVMSFQTKSVSAKQRKSIEFLVNELTSLFSYKKARQQLALSHKIFELAGEVSKIGSWEYDTVTATVRWSKTTYDIHEMPYYFRPEPKTAINFYKEGWSRETIRAKFSDASSKGLPFDEELVLITAKGTEKWVRAIGLPEQEGNEIIKLFGTFQDIDVQKKQEEQNKLMAQITNRTENGVLVTDANGLLTWANDSFYESTGFNKEECIGKKPGDILQGKDTDQETVKRLSDAVKRGESIQVEILNYTKQRKEQWIDLSIQPIHNHKGEIILFFSIQKDITETKHHHKYLKDRNEGLKKLNHQLDSFVYRVTHDLRSPVSSALGLIELIKMTDSHTEKNEYLELQKRNLKKMNTFIQDILDFSKNVREEIKADEINLEEVIQEIIEQLSFSAFEKKVKFILEFEIKKIKSDATRIKIILNNLIANAYKYHNPYTEKAPYVRINISLHNASQLKISISDNGLGIPAAHLPHIFKMFYRVGNNNAGSGLGLYTVSQMVEALEGRIEVTSEVNKGTSFHILLPLKK